SFEAGVRDFLSTRSTRNFQRSMVNFLPGPVTVSRQVRRAFEQIPESHRAEAFMADFQATRQTLCELTGARNVAILLGSGTLANDAIAAQLTMEDQPGLIATNGEFGERLVDHARRFGLDFEVAQFPWGKAFDLRSIERKLDAQPRPGWLWCAHCETSTGMLNDLEALKSLCAKKGVKLCLDCISSIGTTPVNLDGIYFASCASGKGLRSFPGLGMVFYNHELKAAAQRVPRYLDLEIYARSQGVAFTHSSNLVHALHAAIKRVEWPKRFAELTEISNWLRPRLRELGLELFAADAEAAPAVVTIVLPKELSSAKAGAQLHEAGFLLSCNSEYLRQRNWIQICTMGECAREKLVSLLKHLGRICPRRIPGQPVAQVLPASEGHAPKV
ncbi:MAG TPA: aminotransferase class V-fold PLP-dependent enzyme, partial [Verrucomicrobiae bacterium]|nr:aminotransferase class V-fold PLP-dependent enzyme [Verrucomicrobiae bacterium]